MDLHNKESFPPQEERKINKNTTVSLRLKTVKKRLNLFQYKINKSLKLFCIFMNMNITHFQTFFQGLFQAWK